jgi:acyl-CoA synthetase (AMP-forming)/AMP-acid ligase II
MNIGSVLTQAAQKSPDHTAIIFGDLRRTYREFNARANKLADQLRKAGVRKGDRVAILQHNCPELLETLFATFKAGGITVPINARLHPKEFAYILQDSGTKVLVFTDDFSAGIDSVRSELGAIETYLAIGRSPAWARPYELFLADGVPADCDEDCAPDDLAWLFYTSGTTGRPKGAMDGHGNLQFMSDHYPGEVYRLRPDDIVMHPGPLTHGSGLWAIPITANAGTHLIPTSTSFDPDHIFQLIESHRVTKIAFIAPTMITMLLNSQSIGKYDLSSLRFLGYGGSPMYVEDLKRAIKQWGPILCQIYGQGETPMTISMLTPDDHRIAGQDASLEKRLASAGRVREDIEVAILDENDRVLGDEQIGEISLRGKAVMKGYWNKAEATEEAFKNGWYHTGDLGKHDSDGFYYLLDRKKELIISGGANVYPREVEEVLLLHDGVLEVAVIGIPDRLWGESVMAVVRPRPGAKPTEAELLALCRDHLAGYKKPRFFRFQDDLPKSGYGKILKRELKAAILAEVEGQSV